MHIFLATLYAVVIWLAIMSFLLWFNETTFVFALITGPFLISGTALALLLADWLMALRRR